VKRALQAIREGSSFLLPLHRQPDGDSIGASLGFLLGLRQLGKSGVVVSADPIPPLYHFLPGTLEARTWAEVKGPFDAVVLFDCADAQRTGAPRPLAEYARRIVNIDHHTTNSGYGDISYIDPQASAVGEIALRLLDELGAVLEPDIALCLYAAIAMDTGTFRYSATTPQTHRIAARLLDAGLDAGQISEALYEENDPRAMVLLARALGTLTLSHSGRVAAMDLTPEDFAASGATSADAEGLGIVNYARSIRGVEVGCLFRLEGDGVRVSLRSKGNVDVGAIALALGGGGHARAAGVTVAGDLRSARAAILSAVASSLP